ncbi:MAG: hypothetical protein LUD77_04780 [Clostridiales bacterium]|nr:hypothetical protein [Clostridiales bacterium]
MIKKICRFAAVTIVCAVGLTGCGGNENKDETAFREWLVEDYRPILECENNIYGSYTACLDSLEEYYTKGDETSKRAFLDTVDKHKEIVEDNLNPQTGISEDTYGIFEKYNIPLYDYIDFFDMYESTRKTNYYDAFGTSVFFVEEDNAEGAKMSYDYAESYLDWSRIYMLYAAMDMVAESGDNNIEYFRQVMSEYEYLKSDEVQWIYNRDEIWESLEDYDNEYLAALDVYQEYINTVSNLMLEEN